MIYSENHRYANSKKTLHQTGAKLFYYLRIPPIDVFENKLKLIDHVSAPFEFCRFFHLTRLDAVNDWLVSRVYCMHVPLPCCIKNGGNKAISDSLPIVMAFVGVPYVRRGTSWQEKFPARTTCHDRVGCNKIHQARMPRKQW